MPDQFGGLKPFTRSGQRVANNLGIISTGDSSTITQRVRSPELELFDAYFENRQYDGLTDWASASDDATHVPLRKRKPLIIFNFAKILSSRVTAKLVGLKTFPTFIVEDDPDTTELIRLIVQQTRLRAKIIEPMRRNLNSGSTFVRFSFVNGQYKIEHFNSKFCFPEFEASGQLRSIRIQFVFPDENELDEKGHPKLKWFRLDLNQQKDIIYNNPPFNPAEPEPQFNIVNEVEHNFGFVQGEWFRTSERGESVDGFSMIEDVLGFIDSINYSLSQSDQAISYNQDPQLLIKGMDEEEVDSLIRSALKAWNLGKDGEADLLEAGMAGVEAAREQVDRNMQRASELARVVLLDPEKIVGSAQSAKAMEVLHGPMVDLINELRPQTEFHLTNLIQKLMLATLIVNREGGLTALTIPRGFTPKSLNFTVKWPEIFPLTLTDLQMKIGVVSTATNANIISRETGLRFIASDFGVEDIEEEVAKINAQPIFNPFGAF